MYGHILKHDVKAYYLMIKAPTTDIALANADSYLYDWIKDKIKLDDLPEYSYRFCEAILNTDRKPNNLLAKPTIDTVGQMHIIDNEDVKNDLIWIVFYGLYMETQVYIKKEE